MSLTAEIAKIATVDFFKKDPASESVDTGIFVGRPFHLDYSSALLLIADAWKQKAQGIPQGYHIASGSTDRTSMSYWGRGDIPGTAGQGVAVFPWV